MAADKPGIFIGTSGWSYEHWKGNFYPARLPAAEMLPFYARKFAEGSSAADLAQGSVRPIR